MASDTGVGRFIKYSLIGGGIGGLLSAIPLLNILNCCFCSLNIIGAVLGVHLYLRSDLDASMSNGEAAVSGLVSGAIAGAVGMGLGFLLNLGLQGVLTGMQAAMSQHNIPENLMHLTGQGAAGLVGMLIGLVIGIPVYAVFGTLGAFAGLNFMHKDRIKYS